MVLREVDSFEGTEFVELRHWAGEGVVGEADGSEGGNLHESFDVDRAGEV